MSKALELAKELVKTLEKEARENKVVESRVRLRELEPGDVFSNELGKFKVLGHTDAGTKVIQMGFWEDDVCFDDNSCDYTESDLREKFDDEVTPEYESVFGDALVEHIVELFSVDMQLYGSFRCKVRPITFDEVREYNDLIVDKNLPGWWWTCTPWSTEERGWKYSVAVVGPSGNVSDVNYVVSDWVRPVCILKSNIFVSKED